MIRLIAVILLCTASSVYSQTDWVKRTVASAMSAVNNSLSTVNGFIIIGQPLTADVQAPGAFGWMGLLPVIQTEMPVSVIEVNLRLSINGKVVALTAYPNPVTRHVTLQPLPANILSVTLIDKLGRNTALPYSATGQAQITLQLDDITPGAYTIVVQGEGTTAVGRILKIQ